MQLSCPQAAERNRKIACVFLPHFAVQKEIKDHPSLAERPFIIGGLPQERRPVFDASETARDCGISPGMPLNQAYSLCPEGIFLPLQERSLLEDFEGTIDFLRNYSPVIEVHQIGYTFIDASYLSEGEQPIIKLAEHLFQYTGFKGSIGVSTSKFVAWVASQIADSSRPVIVTPGKEQTFLKDLPTGFLSIPEETLQRLTLLGLRRIGQVERLSLDMAQGQFGSEGQRLWELARGIDPSRLVPYQRPEVLEQGLHLDPPAKSLDHLVKGADGLLRKLVPPLKRRWQCCRDMEIILSYDRGEIHQSILRLKEPTSSKAVLLQRTISWLETIKIDGPVVKLRISLQDLCAESGTQGSLLKHTPRTKELHYTINDLQSRYGRDIVSKLVSPESPTNLPENVFQLVPFA